MKFGVNTFIWGVSFEEEHLSLLPSIKANGFDGIEVSMFNPATFSKGVVQKGLADNGLECTICSCMTDGLSLIHEDAAIRAQSVDRLKGVVEMAAEVGAKIVAGPLYSPVGYLPGRRRTADEWSWALDSYSKITDTLDACDVTIAIEPLNRFETYFLNTAEDSLKLANEINHPKVGILFDTFHANIEEKNIADGYRTVAPRLAHVHTCENDRGIPGSGHVEWPEVFAALKEIKYDGWLTIESFGFALGELAAAAAIWRDLASSPEAIAFEGVKFLKENIG
jgi:D-psicose/D-tagatose/L-ribulose 3-epimerase